MACSRSTKPARPLGSFWGSEGPRTNVGAITGATHGISTTLSCSAASQRDAQRVFRQVGSITNTFGGRRESIRLIIGRHTESAPQTSRTAPRRRSASASRQAHQLVQDAVVLAVALAPEVGPAGGPRGLDGVTVSCTMTATVHCRPCSVLTSMLAPPRWPGRARSSRRRSRRRSGVRVDRPTCTHTLR